MRTASPRAIFACTTGTGPTPSHALLTAPSCGVRGGGDIHLKGGSRLPVGRGHHGVLLQRGNRPAGPSSSKHQLPNAVRPADLYLAAVGDRIELMGIEVGIGALARRLGSSRLRSRVRPARVIDWGSVSAFAPPRAEGDAHRGRRSEIAGEAGAAEVRRLRPSEVQAALEEAHVGGDE
jgi:hypothetical protein